MLTLYVSAKARTYKAIVPHRSLPLTLQYDELILLVVFSKPNVFGELNRYFSML
jgi:hypothetical protein